jgi:hypothetical protein
VPRREGLKAAIMRGKRSLLGNMSWDVEVKGEKLLRYSKRRWKTSDGKVIATERHKGSEDKEENADWQLAREEITIQGDGVELWLKDLVVVAWCCRIWHGNGRVSFARSLMRGQGKLIPHIPYVLGIFLMDVIDMLIRYHRIYVMINCEDPFGFKIPWISVLFPKQGLPFYHEWCNACLMALYNI